MNAVHITCKLCDPRQVTWPLWSLFCFCFVFLAGGGGLQILPISLQSCSGIRDHMCLEKQNHFIAVIYNPPLSWMEAAHEDGRFFCLLSQTQCLAPLENSSKWQKEIETEGELCVVRHQKRGQISSESGVSEAHHHLRGQERNLASSGQRSKVEGKKCLGGLLRDRLGTGWHKPFLPPPISRSSGNYAMLTDALVGVGFSRPVRRSACPARNGAEARADDISHMGSVFQDLTSLISDTTITLITVL